MSPEDAVAVAERLADALAEANVPYAITGAAALAVHGLRRMTDDADLAVDITPAQLGAVFDAVERAGCLFERGGARREVAAAGFFAARRGRVRVDLFVSYHHHPRRVSVAGSDGRARWYVAADELALHKLALLRPRDVDDLQHLFAAQAARLDVNYVRDQLARIAPDPADRRHAVLAELIRRWLPPSPT